VVQSCLELLQLADSKFPLDEGLLCYNTEKMAFYHSRYREWQMPCSLHPFGSRNNRFIHSFLPSFPFLSSGSQKHDPSVVPFFVDFCISLLVRNYMVVNEHNKLSNIAQKFKYFRYCWACFRLQYAWNICRWTLKQLIINQIDLWRENGKCSSF